MDFKCLILCVLVSVLCVETVKANPPSPQYAFRISFTDKQGTVSITNPSAFLSSRALARRTNLGIAIDSADLPISPRYIDSVLTLPGSKLHVVSKWLNDCVILVTDSNQIAPLRLKPFVKSAVFVGYYASGLHRTTGTNPKFALEQKNSAGYKPTGTGTFYGATYPQTVMVNGDYLHDDGYKGDGMLIAVMDAGFAGADTHPGFDSLRNSSGILDVHNFVLNNDVIYSYDSHGMAALSTMAGYWPGTYVGTAPLAQYLLYVTEDNNSEQPIEMDNMLAATERADSMGVDVISVSLGYDEMDGNFSLVYADIDGKSTVAAKAANIATKKGILFVASAGNDGGTPWHYILTPGDADSALTIGAVNTDKTPIAFSGYGPNAAGRVKPDVCDLGYQVSVFTPSGGLTTEDGTSFSTPQIAGWAACLWEGNKKSTPFMIRTAIIKSADHYTAPETQLGYGVPDFSKALDYLDVEDTPIDTSKWVQVTPNPFDKEIVVKLNLVKVELVNFSLYDINGRKVYSHSQMTDTWKNPYVTLPIGQMLASGMYMLKVTTGEHVTVEKLIKK